MVHGSGVPVSRASGLLKPSCTPPSLVPKPIWGMAFGIRGLKEGSTGMFGKVYATIAARASQKSAVGGRRSKSPFFGQFAFGGRCVLRISSAVH